MDPKHTRNPLGHRIGPGALSLLFAFQFAQTATAQLTVGPQSNLQQLAAAITGSGVTISNPVITCHSLGYGEYSYSGSGMAITEGVILTSGRITDAVGPNTSTGNNNWFAQNTGGDPLLDAVTGRSTRDACKFEFDIIPTGDSMRFAFTFGSEEYNEWVGSQFNDVFGFFISGPGITGDPGAGGDHNIALIPGTTTPVTINNVNNGSNSAHYYDNTGGSQTQYDGYTVDLAAEAVVQPCQTYHLKLIVADASDRKYDSGVFIEKIQSPTITLSTFTQSGGPDMVEACNPGWIRFDRGDPRPTPLTLQYYLQGTATNGSDYTAIGNVNPAVAKSITIPANAGHVDRAVNPLFDNITEADEYLRIIVGNPNCPSMPLDTALFWITDSVFTTLAGGGTICPGDSTQFTVTGGANYSWTPTAGLSCTTCPNPWAHPANTTTYSVLVTDGSCARTMSRQVRVSHLALAAAVTHPLCNGASNGAINVTPSGGLAPYAYAWTGPGGFTANTQDITNVPSGTYTLTMTDAACTRTQSWNVIDPATLTVSLNPAMLPFGQNVACNGGSTGSVNTTITGGTAPYTITWNGAHGYTSSSANISGLEAGVYVIDIVDAHGCSTSASVDLTESPAIDFTATTTANVLCFGANIGAATSSVSGGIPPYGYSWNSSPAQSTQNASGLAPGSYTVTLSDSYGCTANATVTITGPTAALNTTLVAQTNVLCFGNNTGSAGLSITGGTAPYSTSWNTTPVQNGPAATNLPAGIWTATVTDANGCQTTRNVTITQPASSLSASLFAQTNVSCFGNTTGSATVSASGGTGPYTYQWNTAPVQNTATASNLSAGSYTCTVRDVNLCSTTVNVTITQPAAVLGTSIAAQVNVLCFGQNTGSATINVNGGTSPYNYAWNTAPVQNSASATGLTAGTWTCTVTDANGCSTTRSVNITQPAATLSGSVSAQVNVLCFGNSTGSATVSISGGTTPYSYSWNTSPVQTTATATNLPAGSYTCTISDANG
ncbi:MAG: choice-of-anchor L domain-containing protein, partial [Flavobacteriales bacterium]|nr:choice-of-anchor L domain-containing protein [Flavobacteriales bacterium]